MRNRLEISFKLVNDSAIQHRELDMVSAYVGTVKQFNIVVDEQQIATPESKEETGKTL